MRTLRLAVMMLALAALGGCAEKNMVEIRPGTSSATETHERNQPKASHTDEFELIINGPPVAAQKGKTAPWKDTSP